MSRKKRIELKLKVISVFLLITFINSIVLPTAALALSGGPSAPEFGSFQQASTSDMVDLFSGDFSYNIPLMEVDGYPINISYSGNSGMEQEASWVGLGWNLSPGMINRSIRGVPDDFKGEVIDEVFGRKKEFRVSLGGSFQTELFGLELPTEGAGVGLNLSAGLNLNFSTMRGLSLGVSGGPSLAYGNKNNNGSLSLAGSLGAESGLNLNAGVSFSHTLNKDANGSIGASLGYNSRTGAQQIGITASTSKKYEGVKEGDSKPTKESTKAEKDAVEGDVENRPKRPGGHSGISASAGIPLLGHNSYFPSSIPKSTSTSYGFEFSWDLAAPAAANGITISGSYWEDKIADEDTLVQANAYGYNYLQNAEDNLAALLDFNIDGNTSGYFKGMSYLPAQMLTYDVYSVSGQGFSGTIRPKRMETGAFSEPINVTHPDLFYDAGLELGAGGILTSGVSASVATNNVKIFPWDQVDEEYAHFDDNPLFSLEQNIMFIKGIQQGQVNQDYYASIGYDEAKAFSLENKKSITSSSIGMFPKRSAFASSDKFQRISQDDVVQFLTQGEAEHVGFNKSPLYYKANGTADNLNRSAYQAHHIGEIIATKSGGDRYVYSIPVMNLTDENYTFNVSGRAEDHTNGLVTYVKSDFHHEKNKNGENHFISSKVIPEYSYGFLISSYLSPDYVDVTGDGISDDDIGTAVKFNWTKTHDDYKWRLPMTAETLKGPLLVGSNISDGDQMTSFSYGTKELYYAHSIETKNYIAVFEIEERLDGAQAIDRDGGIDSESEALYKLNKIKLYSKKDYQDPNNASPIPIKTVEFEYDYSLCKHVTNNLYSIDPSDLEYDENETGKLTLKEIKIYYGNDETSALSPYKFTYTKNIDYQPLMTDKWGNYKSSNPTAFNSFSMRDHFPYVNEDYNENDFEQLGDSYAWQLSEIDTPLGNKITVEYESDEYGYVQDKKANQMFKFKGVGVDKNPENRTGVLHEGDRESSLKYRYVFVEIPANYNLADTNDLIDWNYENSGKPEPIYFKVRTRISPNSKVDNLLGGERKYEYVRGYFDPIDIGDCGDGVHLWIKVEMAAFDEKGNLINPILKEALDFGYQNHQKMIFGGISPEDSGIEQFLKNLISMKDDVVSLFSGPYNLMMKKDMASLTEIDGSGLIRLKHASGNKKGGGNRVKSLVMTDNWHDMSSEENAYYGQNYYYDYDNGQTSGVATYEPSKGNDENPFRMPKFYYGDNTNSKKPQPRLYQEDPIGELFYPSASVGYAYVKVESIHAGKKSDKTYSENEFYTARNFPFEIKSTELFEKAQRIYVPAVLVNIDDKQGSTSQGFSLIFNDMHGKPKAERAFVLRDNKPFELSSTEYFYKQEGGHFDKHTNEIVSATLVNSVNCVTREGNIEEKVLGVSVDLDIYSKQVNQHSTNTAVQANLNAFAIPFPVFLPPVWPSYTSDLSKYFTVVTTKVVQKAGILESVKYRDRGNQTTLNNELFDEHTGTVLLTSTETQYSTGKSNPVGFDKQFNSTIPAYFASENDRMGHAYRNLGYQCIADPSQVFLTGTSLLANPSELDAVKAIIYKGYIDGVMASTPLFGGDLSGNQVTAGTFIEGDEVMVSDLNGSEDPFLAFVSEVVTEEDLNYFNSLTGNTWNNLSSPTPSSTSGSNGSNGPQGQPFVLCNGVGMNDQELQDVYNDLVALSSSVSNPPSSVLNAMLNTDTTSASNLAWQFLNDLESGSSQGPGINNSLSDFHSIWSQSWGSDFHNVLVWTLGNPSLRNYIANLNPSDYNNLMSLLRCDFIRPCLDNQVANTGVLQVLDFLTCDYSADQGGIGFYNSFMYFTDYIATNYQNHHFVYEEIIGGTNVCDPENGLYELSGINYKVMNYEEFFDSSNGLSLLNLNANSPILQNATNEGFVESPCGILQAQFFNIIEGGNGCPTAIDLTVSSNTGGNNGTSGNNIIGDDQDYSYQEPPTSELVMFVKPDGTEVDVDGKHIKVIRSGRRNLHNSPLQQESFINYNPFTQATISSYDGLLQASVFDYSDSWLSDFSENKAMSIANDNLFALNEEFNPFVTGNRGIFRPERTFTLRGERSSVAASNSQKDGFIENYQSYWILDNSQKNLVSSTQSSPNWVETEKVISYSLSGTPVLAVNALDIPSAEIVGENNQILATAINSSHSQMLFEPFEEYSYGSGYFQLNNLISTYNPTPSPKVDDHRSCSTADISTSLSTTFSHSGEKSLKVNPSSNINWSFAVNTDATKPYDNSDYRMLGFRPVNETFIVSAWVKADPGATGYVPLIAPGQINISATDNNSQAITLNGGSSVSFYPTGVMIDGWIRIMGEVSLPANCQDVTISFASGSVGCYFDDFRMYPKKGSFKSFVYESSSQKLLCVLDENNYGTFYRYAPDGSLQKLERETINGRLTLKESVMSNPKGI